jgi:hypothetical protein
LVGVVQDDRSTRYLIQLVLGFQPLGSHRGIRRDR